MNSTTARPAIEILEESFREILLPDSAIRKVADGFRFTEGPVWMPNENEWRFSDIPADRMYRWSPAGGLRLFREPSNHANGNTVDRDGRLITCEHGSRRVTRTEPDGAVTILASRYRGKLLNSPNDAVVKSDGSLWFTDPPYGIKAEHQEQPACYVFRLDTGAAEPAAVTDMLTRPNGLAFSPGEDWLYVADSHMDIHHIRRFHVKPDNTLDGGDVFVTIKPHVPDGIRVDAQGRLYSTAGDGVQVFHTTGKLLGKFKTPSTAANCAFGGPDRKTLFITATDSVWAVDLAVAGR